MASPRERDDEIRESRRLSEEGRVWRDIDRFLERSFTDKGVQVNAVRILRRDGGEWLIVIVAYDFDKQKEVVKFIRRNRLSGLGFVLRSALHDDTWKDSRPFPK
jgi:hypothetical protein